MSGDLAAFLRARLDEDAQLARKAAWYPGRGGNTKPAEWSHYLEGGDSGWAVESADGKIGFIVSDGNESQAKHIARHDPARVLAEVETKRRIVDLWEDPAEVETFPEGVHDGRDPDEVETQVVIAETIDHILRLLASVYADHPDYRPEEWKP